MVDREMKLLRAYWSSRSKLARAAVLLAFAAGACGQGETSPAPADDTFVAVEPDLRIDGYAADLVPITWLGVSPQGRIAVTQIQDGAIHFFDEDGNDRGTVGRKGAGPGEFRRPVRGGWLGDTLWISDTDPGRVTLISPALQVLRTLPPLVAARPRPEDRERLPTFSFVFPYGFYQDDIVLAGAMGSAGDPLTEAFKGLALIRVDSTAQVERLVMETPANEGSINVRFDGGIASVLVPFFARPVWSVSPDGAVIAVVTTAIGGPDGGTYRVVLHDAADGSVMFDREYPFAGVPIPQSAIDSAIAANEKRITQPAVRRTFENDAKPRIPPVWAPVASIFVGMDHRVWVGLRTAGDRNPWVVLDTAGEPVARVSVAASVRLMAASAGRAWGLEEDDAGVQSIVRYGASRTLRDNGGRN
jgi:hypothetical protein